MAKKVKNKEKGKAIAKAGKTTAGPLATLERQLADLERRFDALIGGNWLQPAQWEFPTLADFDMQMPRVDVLDKGKKIVVRAELPGVKKEDVEVTATDRSVTIKASTKEEKKEERENYVQREIVTGSYVRTIPLPAQVDGTKAKAKVKDGILHVILPKVGKADTNKVEVK